MIKGIKDLSSTGLYNTTCREIKEWTRGKYPGIEMISLKN